MNDSKHYAELTAMIMRQNGFNTSVNSNNTVFVSLKNRNVFCSQIIDIIYKEELPITDHQVKPTRSMNMIKIQFLGYC